MRSSRDFWQFISNESFDQILKDPQVVISSPTSFFVHYTAQKMKERFSSQGIVVRSFFSWEITQDKLDELLLNLSLFSTNEVLFFYEPQAWKAGVLDYLVKNFAGKNTSPFIIFHPATKAKKVDDKLNSLGASYLINEYKSWNCEKLAQAFAQQLNISLPRQLIQSLVRQELEVDDIYHRLQMYALSSSMDDIEDEMTDRFKTLDLISSHHLGEFWMRLQENYQVRSSEEFRLFCLYFKSAILKAVHYKSIGGTSDKNMYEKKLIAIAQNTSLKQMLELITQFSTIEISCKKNDPMLGNYLEKKVLEHSRSF